MSSSRQLSDLQSQRREPEKSSFAHTCNLLSQYIKEKGSLRDLNLEIDGRVESLEALVKPKSSNTLPASINLDQDKENLPEQEPTKAPDSLTNTVKDASYKSTSNDPTAMDAKSAPLTMFYSDRLLVFSDFPADKVTELLALAKNGSSQMSYCIPPNGLRATAPTGPAAHALNGVGISSNSCQEKIDTAASVPLPPQPEPNTTDLPIARRSSIHRFLEKRKDRTDGGCNKRAISG